MKPSGENVEKIGKFENDTSTDALRKVYKNRTDKKITHILENSSEKSLRGEIYEYTVFFSDGTIVKHAVYKNGKHSVVYKKQHVFN